MLAGSLPPYQVTMLLCRPGLLWLRFLQHQLQEGCVRTHQVSECVCACSVPQLWALFVTPMDGSRQGSSVYGILQARILEWVAIPFSRDLLHPGIEPTSPVTSGLAGKFITTEPPGNAEVG